MQTSSLTASLTTLFAALTYGAKDGGGFGRGREETLSPTPRRTKHGRHRASTSASGTYHVRAIRQINKDAPGPREGTFA